MVSAGTTERSGANDLQRCARCCVPAMPGAELIEKLVTPSANQSVGTITDRS